jgi:lipopolysaccharide export system permease protein
LIADGFPELAVGGARGLAFVPMRLLDRYLLRELLVPFAFCLSGFLLVWVSFHLFNELGELQEKNLRIGDVVAYYAAQSPEFFVRVLPIALLLALLYTLTNLTRHHEITAIRAAGVSLWRLALPYFAVGMASGLVLFVLNEVWAPDGAEQAERIKFRRVAGKNEAAERFLAKNFSFINARDHRTWQIGVYNVRTSEMLKPKVLWTLADGSQRWVDADRARRINGVWTFYNVREYRVTPGTNTPPVPSLQTNVLAQPQFTETPDQIRSEINISKRLRNGGERNADVPLVEIFDYLHFHPHPQPGDRHWLYTKMHERLAAPWTCVVVVLIALPFGAAAGRRNVFVGVAGSIIVCFAYFIVAQIGVALGTGGWLPAWLAGWCANILFGILGLWLTARVR